jgi:lysophospholipase L1-like esterase
MVPRRIVALGASTVYGRVDIEGGGWVGRLRRWHEQQHPRNAVFNLGIGGDTTAGFLARMKTEVPVRKPDLILVGGGLNDAKRIGGCEAKVTTPLTLFRNNVAALIDQARSIAEVIFVGITPFDETKTTPISWVDAYYLLVDAIDYAQATKEICEAEKVPYIDIFNEWLKTDYLPLLADDGLHPNSLGHQKIFESVRDFLIERYGTEE